MSRLIEKAATVNVFYRADMSANKIYRCHVDLLGQFVGRQIDQCD